MVHDQGPLKEFSASRQRSKRVHVSEHHRAVISSVAAFEDNIGFHGSGVPPSQARAREQRDPILGRDASEACGNSIGGERDLLRKRADGKGIGGVGRVLNPLVKVEGRIAVGQHHVILGMGIADCHDQ